MFKVLIFGGTTEGRELAEFCCCNGISCTVSVATDMGASLLPEAADVSCGRLDSMAMCEAIKESGASVVVDATHPFAREATDNIRKACSETGVTCLRLLRDSTSVKGRTAASIAEAVEMLSRSNAAVLSVLGSKSLPELAALRDCHERVWLRLLPSEGIEEHCRSLGFDVNKLILGKGPFTVSRNIEHIKLSGAEVLLTKESGAAGGYPEKAEAAEKCGIELLTVLRPRESGMSAEEIRSAIMELRKENGE